MAKKRQARAAGARKNKATAQKRSSADVQDYRHDATRKNNPPAKIAAEGTVPVVPKARYAYNPHLPPVLRFDPTGLPDALRELVEKAVREPLSEDEARVLAEALAQHQPWLEWSEKREQHERGFFEVDPVALCIHERVSAQAILATARRQDVQKSLFADPELDYHRAVQFYQHEIGWTNRLILGDSLQVMSSLARREDLAGKVQMIYIDPPYGIKFASNFQPEIGRRDVKDKISDLTREPEMVKAYRDTWHLGLHSYLSYLRDRLLVSRELLADTGSIFLQIGDENVHHARELMDDTFGGSNFCSLITYSKTTTTTGALLPGTTDFILWYARNCDLVKYHSLFGLKEVGAFGATKYDQTELPTGERLPASKASPGTSDCRSFTLDNLTSPRVREARTGYFTIESAGESYLPQRGEWKTNRQGIERLLGAARVQGMARSLRYVRYLGDFPAFPLANTWMDIGGVQSRADPKVYTVQTSATAIARCLLIRAGQRFKLTEDDLLGRV